MMFAVSKASACLQFGDEAGAAECKRALQKMKRDRSKVNQGRRRDAILQAQRSV